MDVEVAIGATRCRGFAAASLHVALKSAQMEKSQRLMPETKR